MAANDETPDAKLALAAAVLRGERPAADLEAHGVTLEPSISGDAARAQLTAALEAEEAFAARVATTWKELLAAGAEDGRFGRLLATLHAPDAERARALARDLDETWASEGWAVDVDGDTRIEVTTRTVALGPEVVDVLLRTFDDAARDHGATFERLVLAPRRPWWKLW